MGAGRPRNSIASVLAKHVRKADNGCWEWTGGVDRGGYGKTRVGYAYIRTHRYAYAELVGPIPEGVWVLHRCDNRLCLNPKHLFLGDHKDNLADARQKGRMPGGFRRTLTPEQVRRFRKWNANGMSITAIAKKTGINNWTIKAAVEGTTWKNLDSLTKGRTL